MKGENEEHTAGSGEQIGAMKLDRRGFETALFVLALIAVIAITIYFRTPMLKFPGLYEPDGYFHYSVIKAAISNNFAIPQYSVLSGFPYLGPRPVHHEPFGLYWSTLVPYFFLRFFGVSALSIMRLMPVLFGILDAVGAYFLARYWSRDRLFGLLVMLFIGLNMGNAARTSALIYRGDTFVTFFLILALICTVEIFKNEERNRRIAFMLGAAFFLSLCNLVWNGAPFATATYIFALMLMLVLGYTFDKKKLVSDGKYMLGALLVWYAIVQLYIGAQWIVSVETFTGWHFFILFLPLVLGWYVAEHLTNKRQSHFAYTNTAQKRFGLSAAAIVLAVLVIYALIPSFVSEIFVTSGFQITSNFSSTIQELQAPTYNFLFASFGYQNFTNPMSIMIILSTYFSGFAIFFWVALLALFIPYLFMHTEGHSGGFMSGHAKIHFAFDETTLVLISYFALTAYLQMNAIRFNSLISVPISIFSAYTVYWLMLYAKRRKQVFYASFVVLVILIAYMINNDINYIQGLTPADQINQQFLNAMSWMKNNTAPNSIVLTLWPDGSLVEGVANRTSITDSVGSQWAYKAQPFARWLYNSSPDPAFLLSNITGKPDYFVVRNAWLVETGGIFTEAGINSSSINNYGYQTFTSLNERVNQNQQIYQFFSGGLEEDTIVTTNNSNRQITSYLKLGNTTVSPFTYIGFYNVNNGNYSVVRQTGFNKTNNQTFLILFSSIPAPNLYVNITGAYIIGNLLAQSNMIKLMFECSQLTCAWNNNAAGAQLVFINQDTKIFRIAYNQSNATVRAVNYPRPNLS